jgi:hypothetical protein
MADDLRAQADAVEAGIATHEDGRRAEAMRQEVANLRDGTDSADGGKNAGCRIVDDSYVWGRPLGGVATKLYLRREGTYVRGQAK